jgi:hypothetical protein
MVVLRITVIMFVNCSPAQRHLPQQPCVHQFAESPVNGGAAYRSPAERAAQVGNQIFRIKMGVPAEDVIYQKPALLGNPLAAALQVFLEPLKRRE